MICKRARSDYIDIMMRFLIFTILTCSLLFSSCAKAQSVKENTRLDKIHSKIITNHPNLTHVSAAEFSALTRNNEDILLLDVREVKEYSVSHIEGAIAPNDFMTQFGPQVDGKTVILYCSVGRRSSQLGDKVRAQLMAAGAEKVSNLEGGIFRWHNDNQALVSGAGQTDKVHPYNAWWGRLVARKDDISYKAK